MTTLIYSRIDDLEIRLDIDFPSKEQSNNSIIPAFIFFHGGGLIGGNRQSFIPMQLKKDILNIGWAFISADYRLLVPCTAHDILTDVKNLFNYISSDKINKDLNNISSFHIDSSQLAVGGASAGAYVAYLAAIHAIPKPKAVFGLYGLGGHLIAPFYYSIKSPMTINVADYESYLNQIDGINNFMRPVSDVSLAWPIPEHGEKARTTGALSQVFTETGTLLDYMTGVRGLSESLRLTSSSEQDLQKKIPKESQCLFPELYVSSFPPTYLVHGTADQAAPVDNSIFLAEQLQLNHIPYVLMLAEGRAHGFNAENDAEEVYDKYIKGVIQFFLKHVSNIDSK